MLDNSGDKHRHVLCELWHLYLARLLTVDLGIVLSRDALSSWHPSSVPNTDRVSAQTRTMSTMVSVEALMSHWGVV